jgi:two-component system response regulator HupR/HoxA
VLALNLVSSPGSGKTTLLVKTIEMLGDQPLAVIEGDQQTANDADRIRATGAPAVQVNTGKGCHLDGHMVGHAVEDLNLLPQSLLFIENVGNLVCPAAFDLGEDAKVAILSVTEGEDKPLKYPDMFTAARLAILNKIDLAPHCDVDLDLYEENLRRVNPEITILRVSARTGEGMEAWLGWLLTASSGPEAAQLMESEWVQVVLCDQRMPDQTGVAFLAELRARWPETVRMIITGYTDTSAMIEAINAAGIHQFLTKPWHPEQLLVAVRNAARLFALARENERLALEMRVLTSTAESRVEKRRRALREGMGFETVLRAPHSPMNVAIGAARQFASFDLPVLLTGEPGTGKAQIARAMHFGSLRSDKPFFELNLAGLPEELCAIELMGTKRGVLPGGVARIGLFQKADRGTLYLAGIETAGPGLQLALLRVLTEGSFSPIGGQESTGTSLRLICGAAADLRQRVAEGAFRSDLYFALAGGEIAVPPLRARRGDVAILSQAMLAELSAQHGKPVHGIDETALQFLENHDWPGNMRELRNEITRMLVFAQDPVLGADLISRHILQAPPGDEGADRTAEAALTADGTLKDRVELMEMRILRETLTRHRWNKSRAAAELGLSRVGLRAKLDRYGIAPPARSASETQKED